MKILGLNPYLPFWETIPDGEPHVFGDRLYIFGSHDRRNGTSFCEDDYVCWSAPTDDLGNWRREGVIYRKEQDPLNGAPYDGKLPVADGVEGGSLHALYAPDVAKGPDGRYYLYYALDYANVISVAVCDTPAGHYEFLDYVRRPDGTIPTVGRWFDPAILVEKSGNYLYYGFCPAACFPGMENMEFPGAMMVRLADDMHTIIREPVCVANGVDTSRGTGYEGHPFFEASSIRHIGEWYYFVYSSLQGHELCYGMAKRPEGPFTYKGVIISNGDLGLDGNTLAVNYTGNNHGGMVQVGGKTYIFWHRHTHGTAFSRQGCADEIHILPDGTIPQVPVTSCGLNGGPLPAKGFYRTYIACHLTGADRSKVGAVIMSGPGEPLPSLPADMPYITEELDPSGAQGLKPYINNLRAGAVAGIKSFAFAGDEGQIRLELRGKGTVEVRMDTPTGAPVAKTAIDADDWIEASAALSVPAGVHPLYFAVTNGTVDFSSFTIATIAE